MEPPGWITAVAPASTAASNPSANGKKASDATDEPTVRASSQPALSAASLAFQAAIRADSRRFISTAPIPAVPPPLDYTIALCFTRLPTVQAQRQYSNL